jgi:hypothetical protein
MGPCGLGVLAILSCLSAGPGVTVRVDAKPSHPISAYIYGASAVLTKI